MKDSEQAKRRVGGAADGRSNPPAPVRNPKPGTKNQKPGTRNLTPYLSPRKAVVLAAGFGTRLRPFTSAVPKPLLPVWGEAMLSRVVGWLRGQGVDDIVVNCHYLHEQIEEWCAKNGYRAIYEPEILGTGGVLNPLREWIGGDDFWLVNGDIVFELPEGPVFGGASRPIPGASLLGRCIVSEDGPRTIEVEPDGNLVTNWHSPDPGWSGTWTYCGIALLKAKVLDYVKPQGFSSIIEAYEAAMMDGWFIEATAPKDLLWTDAGTVENYIALNQDGDDNAFTDIPQVKAAMETLGDARRLEFLGARGSDRAFFKTGNAYVIVYDDEKRAENARYAGHAKWLKSQGVRVPEVLADCPAMKTMALENAGGEDLNAFANARRGQALRLRRRRRGAGEVQFARRERAGAGAALRRRALPVGEGAFRRALPGNAIPLGNAAGSRERAGGRGGAAAERTARARPPRFPVNECHLENFHRRRVTLGSPHCKLQTANCKLLHH